MVLLYTVIWSQLGINNIFGTLAEVLRSLWRFPLIKVKVFQEEIIWGQMDLAVATSRLPNLISFDPNIDFLFYRPTNSTITCLSLTHILQTVFTLRMCILSGPGKSSLKFGVI